MKQEYTRLSVNVNKIALLRNSRGGNRPNLIELAKNIERCGAEGITIHPRPDERHIRYSDIEPLMKVNKTEFNIEGYPSKKFIKAVLACKPHQCTLVPDPPGVLTSDSGWDTIKEAGQLQEVTEELKRAGIRTAVFIDPDPVHVGGAAEAGVDRVELYTGEYANAYQTDRNKSIKPHIDCSMAANEVKIGVNAGHDLDLENLSFYKKFVPNLLEVSIGHAIISDALYFGLENTIQMYLRKLNNVNI